MKPSDYDEDISDTEAELVEDGEESDFQMLYTSPLADLLELKDLAMQMANSNYIGKDVPYSKIVHHTHMNYPSDYKDESDKARY